MDREDLIATIEGFTKRQRQAGDMFLHIADNITGEVNSLEQPINQLPQLSGHWKSPGGQRWVHIIVIQDGTFSVWLHGADGVPFGYEHDYRVLRSEDVATQCQMIRAFFRGDPKPKPKPEPCKHKHLKHESISDKLTCVDCGSVRTVTWSEVG